MNAPARRAWVSLSLLAAMTVAAAWWWGMSPPWSEPGAPADAYAAEAPGAGAAGDIAAPPTQPVPVVTARARRGDLVMRITASGTAQADQKLEVTAVQGGTIQQVPVREGDVVTAGALLCAVDDTELRLSLQKARESLVLAIARFTEKRAFLGQDADAVQELEQAQQSFLAGNLSAEQFRSLIDDPRFDALFRTITRQEVIAAQDRLMSTRAEFAQAELDLERAHTLAPFGGQVTDLKVLPGQRIGPGATLMTLVDADPVRVRVRVLESEAGLVRHGRRASVRFSAFPGEAFEGQVEAISPVVDPDTRTLAVTVSLTNPQLRLKPGMYADITLDTDIFTDRLLVPADAVLLRDERPMLFVVREGRAQWVYIDKGRENSAWVEVLSGVEPDDEVIVAGHYSLAHDAQVQVVEPAAADDPVR